MKRRLLSARLERHLERGEEELRRSREAGDRHARAFERMMVAFDRFDARWAEREERFNKRLDESEQVMWEMNSRAENVVRALIRQNAEFSAEQTRRTDAIVAEINEAREEWCEESRAHREALFALIDRMPPAEAA